jgi:protein-tyrosine-phosphatase
MATKTVIVYSTIDGQTLKIANELVAIFKENKQSIDLFSIDDFENYDKILVMDSMNHADVMRLARHEEDRKKVDYLLNLVNEDSNDEVPDPYYGGASGFDTVYDMMDRACDQIISDLQN